MTICSSVDEVPAKKAEGFGSSMTCWRVFLLVTAAVLLPTEWLCTESAIDTQGEVMQGAVRLLFWFSVIWVVLLLGFPRAALAGLLLIALLVIPYQVVLLNRLAKFHFEMADFVDRRMRLRAEGKPIPSTLDDYAFSPELRKSIANYTVEKGGREFSVHYFLQDPGITRSYSSKTGWFYYPD